MDKAFELIYRQMEGMYAWLTDRLPARQDSLFKTYLWSASLALTLGGALLTRGATGPDAAIWGATALGAATGAMIAVVVCLNGMRGCDRDNIGHPVYTEYLTRLLDKAYTPEEALRFMIEQMTETIHRQAEVQRKRAKQLRATSMLLMTSFILLFIAYCLFINQNRYKKEVTARCQISIQRSRG